MEGRLHRSVVLLAVALGGCAVAPPRSVAPEARGAVAPAAQIGSAGPEAPPTPSVPALEPPPPEPAVAAPAAPLATPPPTPSTDAAEPPDPTPPAPLAASPAGPRPRIPSPSPSPSPEPPAEEPPPVASTDPSLSLPEGLPIPDRPEIGAVLGEFCGPRNRAVGEAFRRGERYLPMIRSILAEEGLPEELAYLALVESGFHPSARSPSDAAGLWQFIESTGRGSGLRIDWWVDERLDPEASTRAAARHLKELIARFGDWDLALAAYNAGAGGVDRARAAGEADGFWELSEAGVLRAETRRYVPKFYAAVTISRDPAAFGFRPAGEKPAPPTETVWVDSPVDLATAARLAGLGVGTLRELNPALKRGCTPPGPDPYPLRVPAGSGRRLASRLAEVPASERVTFRRYRVRAGDTLWGIARDQGVPAPLLVEVNRIADPGRLRPGQELVLPTPGARAASGKLKAGETGTDTYSGAAPAVHVVRPGETVWGIARQHGVSPEDLARWNRLGRGDLVRPGDRLAVEKPAGREKVREAERVHVVQEGDSLWTIARRYKIPLARLLEQNGLEASTVLRPGDRLVVGLAGEGPS